MPPTIDDILDISIKYIYFQFSRVNRINPKEGVVLLNNITADEAIIKKFSFPDNFNSKALARPVYWHFIQNYAEILPQEKKDDLIFVRLRNPLPYWRNFKEEILEQEWVKPYLESNLKQVFYV